MKKYQPGANMHVLLPAAEMQCPKCGTWVNNKNRKGRGHDVFLPPGSDQTVLF